MTEEQGPRDLLYSIDALLESAWFDPSTRAEVLSDFAARGVDGTGYGVPIEMSSLVVFKDGERVGRGDAGPGTGPEGSGTGAATGTARVMVPSGAPGGSGGGGQPRGGARRGAGGPFPTGGGCGLGGGHGTLRHTPPKPSGESPVGF